MAVTGLGEFLLFSALVLSLVLAEGAIRFEYGRGWAEVIAER